jgi:hypothetical protein
MYWWNLAATRVRSGETRRFGLITTNSITQTFNRKIVQHHLEATPPLHLAFAVPDHPWVNEADGAAVRVAMTVAASGRGAGTLSTVVREIEGSDGEVVAELRGKTGVIHADLTAGADVSAVVPLQSHAGLSFLGVILVGEGFRLTPAEVTGLGFNLGSLPAVIRRHVNGREIAQRQEGRFAIDLFGLSEAEARDRYPSLYQWLRDRVWPERSAKAGNGKDSAGYAEQWWLFAKPRPEMRKALAGLARYIGTTETARHRVFTLLPGYVLPDQKIRVVASDSGLLLGILSSRVHVFWSFALGGRQGVGNDPVYNNSRCFEPFPFPACTDTQKLRIRDLAEQLDTHRKRQQAQYPDLTLTGIYNVLAKLRSAEPLTAKDKVIHEQGLVSVLKQLHDDLDAAVYAAYGWPTTLTDEELLERLVALNTERAEEEKRGLVRWLRPEFQNPGGKASEVQEAFPVEDSSEVHAPAGPEEISPWPKTLSERIVAVRALFQRQPLAAVDAETVTRRLPGARRKDVEAILESLCSLGLILAFDTADGRRWRGTVGA